MSTLNRAEQLTEAEPPISGAEGDRTLNLRIANVGRVYVIGISCAVVASVAMATTGAIVPIGGNGVNGKTVASDMRGSLTYSSSFAPVSHWAFSREDCGRSLFLTEPVHMSTSPPCPASVPSLEEFRRQFAKLYKQERSNKSAWRVDRVLKQVQALGVTHLRQITREVLSDWRKSPDIERLAPQTQKAYYSALCAALTYAVESGWIDRHPAKAFPMRFSSRKLTRKRHLSLEETRRLFEVLWKESRESWEGHRLYALTLTIFSTGMRPGEAQRLRRDEVLLSEGLIDLTRRPCKTDASSAFVALPDATCDALAAWMPESGSEWVFPHAYRTGPWLSGSPGKKPLDRLQQAGKRAGVDHVTFAMGRHGWVTHAVSAWKLTRDQVQAQTRHTTGWTQDHYRHFDASNQREAVRLIRLPGLETLEGEGCKDGTNTAHSA